MCGVGDEPGAVGDVLEEPGQFALGDADADAALPADEVLVGLLGRQVVDEGAVAHVGVGDETGALQSVECAVDRRLIDRLTACVHRQLVDVVGAEMPPVGGGEHTADGTPTACDAGTVGAERIEEIGCDSRHGATVAVRVIARIWPIARLSCGSREGRSSKMSHKARFMGTVVYVVALVAPLAVLTVNSAA